MRKTFPGIPAPAIESAWRKNEERLEATIEFLAAYWLPPVDGDDDDNNGDDDNDDGDDGGDVGDAHQDNNNDAKVEEEENDQELEEEGSAGEIAVIDNETIDDLSHNESDAEAVKDVWQKELEEETKARRRIGEEGDEAGRDEMEVAENTAARINSEKVARREVEAGGRQDMLRNCKSVVPCLKFSVESIMSDY